MVKVTLKGSYVVKPLKPTPIHRLGLSPIDQIKSWTTETVYFYRPNGQPNFFSAETMKTALSQALVEFYPLAGRIEKDKDGGLELNCNEKGALFVEAESDSCIDDLSNFMPTPELSKLVPYANYNGTQINEWPPLAVQITFFRCGGICLGMGISHVVADGAASMLFITTWAQMARSNIVDPELTPFLDRAVLHPRVQNEEDTPKFDHIEYKRPPMLVGQVDEMEEQKKETTVAVLKLSSDQVELLKRVANEGREKNGNVDNREYSRYESLAGHIWRCASKARGLVNDQETKVQVSVDCRRRLRPAFPANYFGNATFPTTPMAKAGDLISKPLSYAAGKIRESIKRMTDEYVRSAIDFLGSYRDLSRFRLGARYWCPNLAITSWVGLSLYTADFGWGQPFHMGPATVRPDGKAFLVSAENGGIIIYLRLQTEHVVKFKELLYQGL